MGIALRQLRQDGATTGQQITWNGSEWAPGAAGGGGTNYWQRSGTVLSPLTAGDVLSITANAADNNSVLSITKNPEGAQSGNGIDVTMGANATGLAALFSGASVSCPNGTGSERFGQGALKSNTSGEKNAAFGYEALRNNTDGAFNVAFGYQALRSNTTGSVNTASGYQALYTNTGGGYNTASGYQALYLNTTGSDNVVVGYTALRSNTTGSYNAAIGSEALYSNTTGNFNTASGHSALSNNTIGAGNTASGDSALGRNTSGDNNTASGYLALYRNTSGTENTASGYLSLFNNTTGNYNTSSGSYALYTNSTSSNSVAVGYKSLYSSTASGITAIGYQAGYAPAGTTANANTTGTKNTYLGYQTGAASSTQYDNQTTVGYQALGTASNQVVLGDLNVTSVRTFGSLDFANTSATVTWNSADTQIKRDAAGVIGVYASGSNYGKVKFADGYATSTFQTIDGSDNSKVYQSPSCLAFANNIPIWWSNNTNVLAPGTIDTQLTRYDAGRLMISDANSVFYQNLGNGGVTQVSGGVFGWVGSTTDARGGTCDTQIKRDAAGVVGVYGSGSTYGTARAASFGIGGSSPASGQLQWNTGFGAITHVLGPTDQALQIKAGSTSSVASGRDVNIYGGDTTTTGGNGGSIYFSGGTPSDGPGGNVSILATSGVGASRGGGSVSIHAGNAGATGNANGGNILLTTGGKVGSGTDGYFQVQGGNVIIRADDSQITLFPTTGTANTAWLKTWNRSTAGNGYSFLASSGDAKTSGTGGDWTGAAGAAVGSDQLGGSVQLLTGNPTGTGYNFIRAQSHLSSSSSGSTANTALGDRLYISGKKLALSNNTATTFATISVASNTMIAVTVNYTIRASDATDYQVERGSFVVTAVNKGGTITANVSSIIFATQSLSSGTLTVTAGVTTGSSLVNLQITANSSLSVTTEDIAYTVMSDSITTVTPQ